MANIGDSEVLISVVYVKFLSKNNLQGTKQFQSTKHDCSGHTKKHPIRRKKKELKHLRFHVFFEESWSTGSITVIW